MLFLNVIHQLLLKADLYSNIRLAVSSLIKNPILYILNDNVLRETKIGKWC